MENKTVYPEWVQHYRTKGTTVKKIGREHGVKLEELESLKNIYILYMKKGQAVSRISDEQEKLLREIGVDVSMC